MDFLLFILVLVPMLYFHRSTFKVIRDTTTRSPTQPLFSEVVTTEYEESNEDFQETKQLNTSQFESSQHALEQVTDVSLLNKRSMSMSDQEVETGVFWELTQDNYNLLRGERKGTLALDRS